MVTLQKYGDSSVKFVFENSQHYLYGNGEIVVPLNSLILVADNSEMATFKKIDGDIFISARYEEFGMSKAELESWYKENMVGATGGGGGITSGEVQTMIDESISGKADADDVYTIEEVDDAISAATDDMATETWVGAQGYITGVDLSNYATLDNVAEAVSGKADIGDIPDVSDYFDGAEYDSGTTRINFYHGNTVKAYIDASAFVIDGMIDEVRIETIGGVSYLVIDFNTASGKADIQIPLTDIFDPSNYYTKTEIDGIVSGKVDTSIYTAYTAATDSVLSGKADTTAVSESIAEATSGKVDTSVYTAYTAATDAVLSGKADTTAVSEAISAATDDMATKTWVGEQGYLTEHQSLSAYSTTEEMNSAIEGATSGKADTTAVTAVNNVITAHTADTTIHVTSADKTAWNAKSDFSGSYNDLTDKPTIPTVPTSNTAFTNDAGYITSDAISGKADTSAVTESINAAVSGKVDTSTYNTYTAATNSRLSEDEEVTAAGINAVNDKFGGLKLVKLTQAQYDALSPNYDNNTLYVIVN